MFNVVDIINEEITGLFEVRYIKPDDIENNIPLKDNETIVVFHGFYNLHDALLTAKFGLSGQEYAKRIYSYEIGNNPKGLFVTINLKMAQKFASSGVVVEFATKVGNLETPVWYGGRSFYVQGEYTQSFKDDDEREEQRLKNRELHAKSNYPAISQSDRPELAATIYENSEQQALFIGNLNPNMIKAFWANDNLISDRRRVGSWVRMDRNEFLKKYYTKKAEKEMSDYGSDKFHEKTNKIFKPNDDFDINYFKNYLAKHRYDYEDFVEEYIKNWDGYAMNLFFYPKQIEQIKKYYELENIIKEEIQNFKKSFKNILNSREAYAILDNSEANGSTWCAGGCAILAFAVNMAYNYPVYVIFDYDNNQIDHFINKINDSSFIDCDGVQKNILANFKRKEHFMNPDVKLGILPYDKNLPNNNIVIDMDASRKLAELLENGNIELPDNSNLSNDLKNGNVSNDLDENQIINEANIYPKIINYTLKKLGIDEKSVSKVGEGANGVAFKYGDKIIKITSDSAEAEFAGVIKGHKLNRVANVYEVYEIDFGSDYNDNKHSDCFGFCRYYWVIIKDYVPYQGSGISDYYNILHYFDDYQVHNFDYSEAAFDKMIDEYRNDYIEMMADSDIENYDPEDDYELQDDLQMLNYFKELHMELQPLGILSVSDMKESNMGVDENGEPIWFELHIYKDGGYQQPKFKNL